MFCTVATVVFPISLFYDAYMAFLIGEIDFQKQNLQRYRRAHDICHLINFAGVLMLTELTISKYLFCI